MQEIADACAAVRRDATGTGSADDLAYFDFHERRFRATVERLREVVPKGAEVLDVGGHYLHLSSILALLGYRVIAIDVPAHARLPFVPARASRMGVTLVAVDGDAIAGGSFFAGKSDLFDAVLFCEILEHITFNPIALWRRVHGLLRANGCILLTTPNSLKLLSVLGAVWNLLSLRRIGLSVKQIMNHATFGQHWKEYSAGEIHEYFRFLSPDFHVDVRKVHYGPPADETRRTLGALRLAILRFGNATGFFADNLQAVITVPVKTEWTVREPTAG